MITIIMPTVIVKTISFVPRENTVSGEGFEKEVKEPPKVIISNQPISNSNNMIGPLYG